MWGWGWDLHFLGENSYMRKSNHHGFWISWLKSSRIFPIFCIDVSFISSYATYEAKCNTQVFILSNFPKGKKNLSNTQSFYTKSLVKLLIYGGSAATAYWARIEPFDGGAYLR